MAAVIAAMIGMAVSHGTSCVSLWTGVGFLPVASDPEAADAAGIGANSTEGPSIDGGDGSNLGNVNGLSPGST